MHSGVIDTFKKACTRVSGDWEELVDIKKSHGKVPLKYLGLYNVMFQILIKKVHEIAKKSTGKRAHLVQVSHSIIKILFIRNIVLHLCQKFSSHRKLQ
jgi:hypothetical protein